MKIDAEAAVEDPAQIVELSKVAEDMGFDCFWVNETKHDPFLQLALAATSTEKISLGTSIALAFTRSPTTLAHTAWDIQRLSNGRLLLGLGSQVKGHIERRFGMEWQPPAPKMKEVILAMRSVWHSWQDGAKLDYKGKFFRLDLMTPFFSPGSIEHPHIPIYVAGVNEGMCRVAGAVADGLHIHPLHTVKYLREIIEPSLATGIKKAGRSRSDVEVAASVFAAVGGSRKEIEELKGSFREQIAFYASTRTYGRVLDLEGWGEVGNRLHELSMKGDWQRMAAEVTDDMLHEFVVEGSWEDMGRILGRRYQGLVDRVRLYIPFDGKPQWKGLVRGFRS